MTLRKKRDTREHHVNCELTSWVQWIGSKDVGYPRGNPLRWLLTRLPTSQMGRKKEPGPGEFYAPCCGTVIKNLHLHLGHRSSTVRGCGANIIAL
jgi:hypothetical protein